MSHVQCPVCYASLEVRNVTPCTICGGWPQSAERFDSQAEYYEWQLPSGERLTLCRSCELEEFMVPAGWGHRLGLLANRLPVKVLQLLRPLQQPQLGKDKFCTNCNLR